MGRRDSRDQARGAFGVTWHFFPAKRTDCDFDAYRRNRAFDDWKEAMWAKGLKLPTQVADSRTVCFCSAPIGIADMDQHVYAAHMELEVAPEAI